MNGIVEGIVEGKYIALYIFNKVRLHYQKYFTKGENYRKKLPELKRSYRNNNFGQVTFLVFLVISNIWEKIANF